MESFADLQAKGDENVVCINKFTSKVQAHIIVSQLVGSEYCFKPLVHIDLTTGEEEKLTISDFMDCIMKDMIARVSTNPFISINTAFAEKELFTVDTRFFANAKVLRDFIRNIIDERKANNDPEAFDIISLLLQDENYQNPDDIIDDILVMFIAGSKTVQNTTSNLITSMLHEPEQLKRMHSTIDPYMAEVSDNIMEKMTMESVEQMEYVKMAYMEVMRRDAPAGMSSTACMTKDMKIGGITMYAQEALWIGIQALHKDPE